MWLPASIIEQVYEIANIRYIDSNATAKWNRIRHKDELRLLTGWMYQEKRTGRSRQGLKTKTVAIREAYYDLILNRTSPGIVGRRRLRVVHRNDEQRSVA